MDRLPVAVASIYTYVNPMVAVLLGWAVYREPVGWREGVGMLVIFVGVAMVKRASAPPNASVPPGKIARGEELGAQSAAESGQYGE